MATQISHHLNDTARKNMVLCQLLPGAITNRELQEAMANTPRELFVPEKFQHVAYLDNKIAITDSRYLVSPLTLATMLQAAEITKEDLVLDIGCCTGYSTAILAALAKKVISIESEQDLASTTNFALNQLHIENAIVITEPLAKGHKDGAPYDVIIINGAIESVPEAILEQLADNGRLVYIKPIKGRLDNIILVKRHGDHFAENILFDTSAPMLPGF